VTGAIPVGSRTGITKSLLDGAVSALQAHARSHDMPTVVTRLADYFSAKPDYIEDALQGSGRRVLGSAERAPHLTKDFVALNPDDRRLVAAEVVFRPSEGPSVIISGEACGVIPR